MAATLGMASNIRQEPDPVEEAPAEDIVIIDEGDPNEGKRILDNDGNTVRIEYADGSVEIAMDGGPLEQAQKKKPLNWFDNLAEDIGDTDLSRICEELLTGIEEDLGSRTDWIEQRAQGMKLLGLKIEIPQQGGSSDGAPVEGQSRVRHPMMLEALLRFQANARSELLPTDGPVKVRNDSNNSTPQQDLLANCLEMDLNHYLTVVDKQYYPDTDKMLMYLGFGGSAFKKVYFCPLRNRPISETVDANDLIVNNAATDLQTALRITHRSMMKPSTVKRFQILDVYRDVPLSTPSEPQSDALKEEMKALQGLSSSMSMNPDDRDREIYECYCELDIPGYEHTKKGKPTGLKIPYRVTIDVSSRQILSIVRNFYKETEALPEAIQHFIHYVFVPGFGFYGIGFVHILGNTTNAVTAAWRELLDAGMFSSFPGFLYSDAGARQNTTIFRVPPGGGAKVNTGGMRIQDAIMPLPYKEPSGALMSLAQNMADTGQRVGGTAEADVGEGKRDLPVGTALALIEQQTKVLNSVHKRMHSAQAQEFQLLVRCFKEHPDSFWQRIRNPAYPWDEQTFLNALNDCELVPQADPNTASYSQRIMKIMALKQLQQQNQSMYDPLAIDRVAIQALGWGNPDQFFAPPSAQQQPPPEVLQGMEELKIKHQDADARTLLAQSKAKEVNAKLQGLGQPPEKAQVDPQQEFQLKQRQQQLKEQAEIFQQQRASIDDENRDKDRQKDLVIEKARLLAERLRDERQMQHEKFESGEDRALKQHSQLLDLAATPQQPPGGSLS